MSGRADVVHGTGGGPELCSDVGPASKGFSTMTAWPLSDTLSLGALPTAVASARLHARMMMSRVGVGRCAEDVALVVSELVTNAVAASTDADGQPQYADEDGGLPVVHLAYEAITSASWLKSGTRTAKSQKLDTRRQMKRTAGDFS